MIAVYWQNRSTRQLPEGGYGAEITIGQRLIDGTTSESYDFPASATEHPTELDADIADHYKRELGTITLECAVSKNPSDPRLQGDDNHVDAVLDDLKALEARRIPVYLATGRGLFENYLVLLVGDKRDQSTGDGATFQLVLREYRTATAQEVEAPAPSRENNRRRRDRGRQAGGNTGDDNAVSARGARRSPEEQRSALLEATDTLVGAIRRVL